MERTLIVGLGSYGDCGCHGFYPGRRLPLFVPTYLALKIMVPGKTACPPGCFCDGGHDGGFRRKGFYKWLHHT